MKSPLKLLILKKTEDYIKSLSVSEQIKITSDFKKMSDGNPEIISTKQLRSSIRELIVGNHRLIYFIDNGALCFVDAFRKRSQKTPKNKIENAIGIYKTIKNIKKKEKRKMKSKLIKKEKIDYKWVSFDNLIKDLSKNKDFKKGYHEELAKLKIAQQIREARKEKKITQLVVAKRAGMPQSVVARIESGNHGTSLDTLAKVAHALGKEVKIV